MHRGAGYASAVCTSAYEAARASSAGFAGARGDDVVIFTRNTTDALNLLAGAVPGRRSCHLDIEHHANLLPWQRAVRGRRTGAGARAVEARAPCRRPCARSVAELARTPAALLAVTGASNVTGECLPLAELAALAHPHGARIVVDGAQLVPHRRVALAASGIDYLAFSGHKLYAPFGAGVLVGRGDWLDAAPPYLAGGGAVRQVRLGRHRLGRVARAPRRRHPERDRRGRPRGRVSIYRLAARRERSSAHEGFLTGRLVSGLAAIDGVRTLRVWPTESRPNRTGSAWSPSPSRGGPPRTSRSTCRPSTPSASATAGSAPTRSWPGSPRPVTVLTGQAVRASLGLGSRAADVDRLLGALARSARTAPPGRTRARRPASRRAPIPVRCRTGWPAARSASRRPVLAKTASRRLRPGAAAGGPWSAGGDPPYEFFQRVELGGAEAGEPGRRLALDPQHALRRLLALRGQGDELAAPVGGVGAAAPPGPVPRGCPR